MGDGCPSSLSSVAVPESEPTDKCARADVLGFDSESIPAENPAPAAAGADVSCASTAVPAPSPAGAPLPAVVHVGCVASTNDAAIEAARDGAPAGYAVVADEQIAGRGRRGHAWESPAGGLYLSCVLRPKVPMSAFTALPAVVAMGVIDALRSLGAGSRVGIKWANDIVACAGGGAGAYDRKLAGILVEARSSEQGAFAVAGIGMNLGAAPKAHAEEAGGAAAGRVPALEPISLAEVLGTPVPSREELAVLVRDAVLARVEAWGQVLATSRAAAPLAPVLSEYFDMVPMLGHDVAVLDAEGRAVDMGCFTGLDMWGRALVRTPSGEERAFSAEAVSLREL